MFFKKMSNREVKVFTDAYWGGSSVDCRFISDYCTFVWGNLVPSWSKNQSVVARSSVKAELWAMCQGIWLGKMLQELKISKSINMTLFCDNNETIEITKSPIHDHDRRNTWKLTVILSRKSMMLLFWICHVPSNYQCFDQSASKEQIRQPERQDGYDWYSYPTWGEWRILAYYILFNFVHIGFYFKCHYLLGIKIQLELNMLASHNYS